jgi:hypothetical protein
MRRVTGQTILGHDWLVHHRKLPDDRPMTLHAESRPKDAQIPAFLPGLRGMTGAAILLLEWLMHPVPRYRAAIHQDLLPGIRTSDSIKENAQKAVLRLRRAAGHKNNPKAPDPKTSIPSQSRKISAAAYH